MPNVFQRGSRRLNALALDQRYRMIEIIYAVQRRKSAEREVPVGPKH
jgi:hypothetical protein